jgi:beta-mannanase
VLALEERIGTTLPLVQSYTAWGDKADQQFPIGIVTAVSGLGSIPLVTWEPWLTDFESARHPHLPLRDARDRHGMGAVARGDYDFYIDAWAAAAARFGKPFLLRFAHEMNDPYRYPWGPQHNTKEEYIAAWRRVVDRFRAAGANNVVWVWSPHVAYEYWDLYYPGDDYVDWVATGTLNFGPIAQWSRWWTFAEIFGEKYPRMAAFGKPIMVAELGSLAVGGDRAAWYREAITAVPEKYPAVKALVFFHARDDQTVTYQKVDWTVTEDSITSAAIRDALAAASLAR